MKKVGLKSKTTSSNLVNNVSDRYVFVTKLLACIKVENQRCKFIWISYQPFSRSWLQFFPEICSLLYNWLIFKTYARKFLGKNTKIFEFFKENKTEKNCGRHLPCPTRPPSRAWETGSWRPTPHWSSRRSGSDKIHHMFKFWVMMYGWIGWTLFQHFTDFINH